MLKLIMAAIEARKESKGFLIDGYPRELQQGIEFERIVKTCLFFHRSKFYSENSN